MYMGDSELNDNLQVKIIDKEFIEVEKMITRLDNCPEGMTGCYEYESICVHILDKLFVPPLGKVHIQCRTESGNDVRDAIFPNRSDDKNWKFIREKYNADFILFEFKNYAKKGTGIDKHTVNQISSYLKPTLTNFGIICSKKKPSRSALIKRSEEFRDHKKLILFLSNEDLKKMLRLKCQKLEPSDVIIDLIDKFRMEY